jgi:murein DD-endopeptidase MepM/ murein hydrolase activator NlpD
MTLPAVAIVGVLSVTTPCQATETPTIAPTPVVTEVDLQRLRERALLFPVPEISPAAARDTFAERRGGSAHEALDVAAPRGAPVVAVDDGVVAKLFRSVPGGLTVYLFDDQRRYAYYYAHLDAYAADLAAGQRVRRGQVIGYVGSSGNAAVDAPHLHFAIFKLESEPRWWRGTPINPYPLLVRAH